MICKEIEQGKSENNMVTQEAITKNETCENVEDLSCKPSDELKMNKESMNIKKLNDDDILKDRNFQHIMQLKSYSTFDHIFHKQRTTDFESYWFLKSLPLNLESSEKLCEPLTLSSILQEDNVLLDTSSLEPDVLSRFIDNVTQSQPLPQSVLKNNTLSRIKCPSHPELLSQNSKTSFIKSAEKKKKLKSVPTFRVSLASNGITR